jgi:hypothetical protein
MQAIVKLRPCPGKAWFKQTAKNGSVFCMRQKARQTKYFSYLFTPRYLI